MLWSMLKTQTFKGFLKSISNPRILEIELQNTIVKMQVLELLCAVCTYSSQGHMIALNALLHLKVTNAQVYGCDLIMYELRNTQDVTYQTRLLCFINCLTLSDGNLQKRVFIRNKFLSRGLGELMNSLSYIDDTKLQFQVLAFTYHQHRDEIKLKSRERLTHHQLFEAILKKIADTPQASRLHSIMQKLSQLDLTNPNIDNMWGTVDEFSSEGESLWTEMQFKGSNLTVDFYHVEELFCQNQANMNTKYSPGSLSTTVKNKVTLLETKRNLAVNVYLKQFKLGGKEIIDAVKNLKAVNISTEKLSALLPLLPTEKELNSIKSYSGDLECLGEAEKFYLQLSEIPSFALRIRAMLLKEEFLSRTYELKEKIKAIRDACNKLMTNDNWKDFLALVLYLGNYLNAGISTAGFTLRSLPQLLQIKANEPGLTFLHYVLQIVEANNKQTLQFTEDLSDMKEMARISLAFLQEEVMKVTNVVKYVESLLKEDKTGIRASFREFLETALEHTTELQEAIKNVEACSRALAKYYCEDPETFQPEDCFRVFADILNMIDRARLENEKKRQTRDRNSR